MAVVLHSSDVFAIAKTHHQQIDKDVYLFMRYLLLIFAKVLCSIIFFLDSSLFMFMADWRRLDNKDSLYLQ